MRRTIIGSVVLALGSAGFGAIVSTGSAGASTALARPADPVVLTGADVPALQGAALAKVVGFRANGADWTQIPIQIDERGLVDLGLVYHQAASGVRVLGYTSAATWAGGDKPANFDANDELAFMARDSGARATAASEPAGTVPGSGVAVHITDPLAPSTEGYVYLFRVAAGSTLKPGAGKHYVRYSFRLVSGGYKKTYHLTAGPNPENSIVTGLYYTHHFGDRWLEDQIKVKAPGSTNVDILDRHKALFAPGNCVRSEDTFDAGEGAFIINKVGAVRAIRSYIGANSGPNTERTHVFYDRREDVTTDLRVHAIPGVMDFFDYSPAASGMTFRNEANPAGVPIDGVPDSVSSTAGSWEQVTGPQGTLTMVSSLSTTFPTTVSEYYLDDTTPSDMQCTGDSAAYGSSGARVTSSIPCTDPGNGCTDTLSGRRTVYFDGPGGTASSATALRDGVNAPLTTSATAWP